MTTSGKSAGQRWRADAPPATAVTVDVIALTVRSERLEVLLVRRAEEPHRSTWSLPGGFVRPTEDLPDAAARQLADKAGISDLAAHLEQLGTYGAPDRDPRGRVITVAYLAFAPACGLPRPAHGVAGVSWCAVSEFGLDDPPASRRPDAPRLAFDHEAILAAGVERARAKLEYSALGTAFCTEPFTAADLRRVYEAVWAVPLDPRNFWRKVSSTPGLLVPVPGLSVPGLTGGRPAGRFRRGSATMLHPPILRPHRPDTGPA
ncbi:MAG: NUDIX hydrolase [Actinobacteria bacterium]|nr:NUDIX hydrolase [Actinomycetota bacterium]